VGTAFSDVARRIQAGEETQRNIRGTATHAQVRELHDEGVPVFWLPDVVDKKKLN
jgi:hypothetical protein